MATIGIDLGTFNSAAAYRMPDGGIELLQAYHGPTIQGKLIPSFMKFYANGELEKYGWPAYEALETFPELVVWGLKRLLGKSYHNAKNELHRFKYPIQEAEDGSIIIPIGGKEYTPIELITLFLQKIKKDCEADYNPIGSIVNKAIITHPAYFDGSQTASVKDAALGIGFEEVELISEPEAAALAYKDLIDFSQKPLIMVIDWGAGTLDIVLTRFSIDKKRGQPCIENAYAPYGDTTLGGIDMDDAILKRLKNMDAFSHIDPLRESGLRGEIEKKKIVLSEKPWTQGFFKGYSFNFARSKEELPAGEDIRNWLILEDVISPLLQKFRSNLLFALKDCGISPDMIDRLILVGGPMYMRCVRRVIREVFQGNEKVIGQLDIIEKKGFPVSPLEAVVRGAILKEYHGETISASKRTQFTYGFLLDGKQYEGLTIPENTAIAGDRLVKEGKEFGCQMVGRELWISLYKKVRTPEGEKHFKKGNYKLITTAMPNTSPAYKPIIEIDTDLICTLKVIDLNSEETLELLFKNEREYPIPPPEEIKPLDRQQFRQILINDFIKDGMPDKRAELEAEKLCRDIFEGPIKGEISAEAVNEVIKRANNCINFIKSLPEQNRRNLKRRTLEHYEELKQIIPLIVPDQPIKVGEGMDIFNKAQIKTTSLESCLKNLDGFTV